MLRCSSKGKTSSILISQLLEGKRRVKKLPVSGKYPFDSRNIHVYFGDEIHDRQHMALELSYLKSLFLLCPLVANQISRGCCARIPKSLENPTQDF